MKTNKFTKGIQTSLPSAVWDDFITLLEVDDITQAEWLRERIKEYVERKTLDHDRDSENS